MLEYIICIVFVLLCVVSKDGSASATLKALIGGGGGGGGAAGGAGGDGGGGGGGGGGGKMSIVDVVVKQVTTGSMCARSCCLHRFCMCTRAFCSANIKEYRHKIL